ncbi:MAG: AraC family transcriptional regulator [Phycisphaerae bacterium]|nr:AraC family transcriptional regulator [Phycisphaerae bacterium]
MAEFHPRFRCDGRAYHADTCAPLVRGLQAGHVRLEALARRAYPGRRIPRRALQAVSSVGFWDAAHDQEWGLDWHRNEGIELTFLESGRLPFAIEKGQYDLRAGEMTITRPWQPHRVGDPFVTAGRLHWLILDVGVRRPNQAWTWPRWLVMTDADRKRLTTILRHNEQPVWRADEGIRRCFQRIAGAVECDRAGSQVSRLTVHLNELFVLVLELFRRRRVALDETLSSTSRTVELFLQDIRNDLEALAHPWSVHEMAEQCGLGVTRFVHHCRQLTNMTPMQYLNHCRVEAAAKLLCESKGDSVTTIAMRCGFSSSQYFSSMFRRHFGRSPREHRRSGQ